MLLKAMIKYKAMSDSPQSITLAKRSTVILNTYAENEH